MAGPVVPSGPKGGWGGSWGGSWGGVVYPPGPGEFASPLYPVPLGKTLGSVKIGRPPPFRGARPLPPPGPPQDHAPGSAFSGEWSGLFDRPSPPVFGAVFFSPSLLAFDQVNEVDLDDFRVTVRAGDSYSPPVQENVRNFTFGPLSKSRTNSFLYRVQPKAYTAVGTMVQTIPPGPTTVFRVT